jgi:DNA-binding HxlR family transcriptional regulator
MKNEDVFEPGCAARTALERVTDKWAVLLILLLKERPYRFNQMRRTVGGVSQKMLTQTLRNLERDGLVRREVYATTPPQVEYTLTPLGLELCRALDGMREWAESHVQEVLDARERFDARSQARTSAVLAERSGRAAPAGGLPPG